MKKILNLAVVAALALGIVSCTKDATEPQVTGSDQAEKTLTFVMPSQSGVITYAGEVAASANEKQLDLTRTSIFMFSDTDSKLEAILSGSTQITAGTNTAGKPTATIEIDGWEGDKTFFIVGNTHMDALANLPTDANIGDMTIDQFMAIVTVAQTATMDATDGLLMSGMVQVADIDTTPTSDITLYRSVARFDVNQDVTANGVLIKRIDVADANLNGLVYAYNRTLATGLSTGAIDNIAVSSTLTQETVSVNGFDEQHDFQKQESVFYMYPTNLKADGSSGSSIILVGDVNGSDVIFTLNKEDSNLPVDCDIKANTRYIISAIKRGNHTFTITVAEWDEGDELVGRPNIDNGTFGIASVGTVTNGTFNALYNSILVADATQAFSASLKVKGSSSKGVTAEVLAQTATGLIEVDGTIISATATYDNAGVTYAVPYFGYDVAISFDAAKIDAGKNFTTIVRLTDKASKATTDITVYTVAETEVSDGNGETVPMYETGAGLLPAVKIGDVYWAPVNVGATTLDYEYNGTISTAYAGYLFQWGRNISIERSVPMFDYLTNTIDGPISYDDAHLSAYSGSYILTEGSQWMTDYETLTAWDNNTPCPTGWRLPVYDDLNSSHILLSVTADNLDTAKNRFTITISEGNDIHFPITGHINEAGQYRNGSFHWMGSTYVNEIRHEAHAYVIAASGSSATRNTYSPSGAFSVRCVKDAE